MHAGFRIACHLTCITCAHACMHAGVRVTYQLTCKYPDCAAELKLKERRAALQFLRIIQGYLKVPITLQS